MGLASANKTLMGALVFNTSIYRERLDRGVDLALSSSVRLIIMLAANGTYLLAISAYGFPSIGI